MTDLVTIEVNDPVADVRLNRPEKYNAISPGMFDALVNAGEALMNRSDVRVVVLSGNGPGFCAGLDMNSFQGMADRAEESTQKADVGSSVIEGDIAPKDERPENRAQRAAFIWKKLPMPVIAALHGVSYGGGCQIALGADIRFAAPSAKLSVLEIKWGLIPDMSLTQTLRDIVSLDIAKELAFTGKTLSAAEAKEIGLVTHVVDNPLEAAFELATTIASKSPDAVRFGKRLLETSWHADERTGLQLEAKLQGKLIGSENQVEAIKANFENRDPAFKDASL